VYDNTKLLVKITHALFLAALLSLFSPAANAGYEFHTNAFYVRVITLDGVMLGPLRFDLNVSVESEGLGELKQYWNYQRLRKAGITGSYNPDADVVWLKQLKLESDQVGNLLVPKLHFKSDSPFRHAPEAKIEFTAFYSEISGQWEKVYDASGIDLDPGSSLGAGCAFSSQDGEFGKYKPCALRVTKRELEASIEAREVWRKAHPAPQHR
jgi:hypothetical protein